MGWGGKSKSGGNSGYWGYWQGSYAGWNKDKDKDKDKKSSANQHEKQTLLVPYDQMRIEKAESSGAEMVQVVSRQLSQGTETNLLKELQTCVNAARKAEQKVKKLAEQKQQKILQWKKYEKDVRSQFLAERSRHTNDLQQLEIEMDKALAAQEHARARVRTTAQGSDGPKMEEDVPQEMEVDPWQECLVQWEAEEAGVDDSALRAVLERAMLGAPVQQQTPLSVPATPPTSHAAPRSPIPKAPSAIRPSCPDGGTRLIPFPPPKNPRLLADHMQSDQPEVYAAVDPYQRNCSSPGLDVGKGLVSPPLGAPKAPKTRTGQVLAKAVMHPPAQGGQVGHCLHVQNRLESKRLPSGQLDPQQRDAESSQSGGVAAAHFSLDYDDDMPAECGGSAGDTLD